MASENSESSHTGDTPIDIEEFSTTNYAIPAQKSVQELLEADKEDESLKKFQFLILFILQF